MENTISFNMPFFEKNPAYFFKAIRTNNRIRDIINNCKCDNIDDIQDEKDRDDVRSYLENRGCIFINKYSGYMKYIRNDYYNSKNSTVVKKGNVKLSPDKGMNVFEFINFLLNKTLISEVRTCSCKNDGYYCEEHKIHNHNCININDYYFDDYYNNTHMENGFYSIHYLNNKTYNHYVGNYNKFYNSLNKDEMNIEDTTYYIFKKPYKFKFFKKENKPKPGKRGELIKTKKVIKKDKIIKTKKYKDFYDINKLFFLSYQNDYHENYDSRYLNINYFLSEDEILDILDYYYFNKDFIDYNASYEIYSRMSFEEYLKSLKKDK